VDKPEGWEDFEYTWQMFDDDMFLLASSLRMKKDLLGVVGVPRGGLVAAVTLSNRLGLPLWVGTDTVTEKDPPLGVPFMAEADLKRVLVVDDVCETGETMRMYSKFLRAVLCTRYTHVDSANSDRRPFDVAARVVRDQYWIKFPWE
jgi:hypoxanthine phosphoribosyltransferase